jgi:hypothetical protein
MFHSLSIDVISLIVKPLNAHFPNKITQIRQRLAISKSWSARWYHMYCFVLHHRLETYETCKSGIERIPQEATDESIADGRYVGTPIRTPVRYDLCSQGRSRYIFISMVKIVMQARKCLPQWICWYSARCRGLYPARPSRESLTWWQVEKNDGLVVAWPGFRCVSS